MQPQPFIVGITGGSASGKTSFLNRLVHSFSPNDICLISQDNYYKPIEEQPQDMNGVPNFDTPDSIDLQTYKNDIAALKSGKTVERLEYTFNNPNVKPKLLVFNPSPIIIVEGIFVFYFQELAKLLDLKIYIESRESTKLKRRIIRDKVERGYDLDDVLYRWEHHVIPTYEKYISPFKHEADVVIPNNSGFDKGIDVVINYLTQKVKQAREN